MSRCIAYTEKGDTCGRPATVLDPRRGGMVCHVHQPKRSYEVTRAYLGKVEELLGTAAEQSRKERAPGDGTVESDILDLKIKTRRVRTALENGK